MDYPKSVPGVGLVGGKFIDENVQTGQQGSLIPAAWGNAVSDEILSVITGAGLTPDESAYDQLLEAIETLIASGAVTYESSAAVLLADGVASAGARNTAARGDHRHPTDTSREPARAQATQAEMEAGTEANVRSMSPLRVAQAIAALAGKGVGVGQTWTDVKASRAYGVTYTNSTGKPIEVFVTNSGGSQMLKATVGSVVLGQQMSTYNTSTPRQCFSFVVPNAETYKVDCNGTLEYWTELR